MENFHFFGLFYPFDRLFVFKYTFEDMPGTNCAFFGCGCGFFYADAAEHTATLKRKTREEWLRAILRTREMEPEFKKRIEAVCFVICVQRMLNKGHS